MEKLDYQQIKELVLQAKAGKQEAFTTLYELTQPLVLMKANKYLYNQALSEDAVQETYMIAYKKFMDLKDEMLFVSWLLTICEHVSLQLLKKRKRQLDELGEAEEEDQSQIFFFEGFEDSLMFEEEKKLVRKAIRELPDTERRIIVYHFFEEMKIDDIAEVLHISRSTVKRKLKTAEELLKERLADYEEASW